MTPKKRRRIGEALRQRAGQWRTRIGFSLLIALAFWPMVGLRFALTWTVAYVLVQAGERFVTAVWTASPRLRRRLAPIGVSLVLSSNLLFAVFALRQAMTLETQGLVCAALLLSGALINGLMVTAGSRTITAVTLGPHLCALAALPVFMRIRYDQPLPALQLLVAGLLLAAATVAAVRGLSAALAQRRTAEATAVAARRLAEAASRAKSDFIANMSHEIRTPLNGVIGMARALSQADLPPREKEQSLLLVDSGEALRVLLNDMLDLSKIEAGKLTIDARPFALRPMLEGVTRLFEPAAAAKGLTIGLEIAPGLARTWIGDEARIRQILSNLVSNAVKFTSTGGLVVSAAPAGGSSGSAALAGLRLAVVDTGPGIDPAQMDRLFQKFVQLDESSTRRHGGTGLGLALCADLTSLMEGEIQVRRAPSGGMEFLVLLPLKTGHADLAETPPHEPAARDLEGAPLWVLAAEDHPTNRKVLELLLEPTGVHCRFVENGQEAVEAWREQNWDVILMDVQMPVMDGLAATRAIRSEEAFGGRRRTPIIALTANALQHQQEEYAAAGMDDFVGKPIQPDRLYAALSRAAEQSEPLTRSADAAQA
ncbi:response regulator [Brevundimonas sp. P7753]|jgi:signal transduction histidine kinase/CheY-like chemotaxis protein|uniref:response regulator n=1 Tax=Brevundimonas sp. P7753 TaxID=2726982 RepID=UPI0015BD31DF|nr:response regulator [Brevundimonas sp. P7753]NWE51791.1 response regulator [Brevundimonas sp. P7753]